MQMPLVRIAQYRNRRYRLVHCGARNVRERLTAALQQEIVQFHLHQLCRIFAAFDDENRLASTA
jgi:hypothetical protein